MTAEIAIINRTAVALAADSAMTLSGGLTDKIYNSADKIFELSVHNPIGLMIFNNLEFMGMPLDVIIKRFRDSNHCTPCNTVEEAADRFSGYLLNEIGATPDLQSLHVERLLKSVFESLVNSFYDAMLGIMKDNPTKPPKGFSRVTIFTNLVNITSIKRRVSAEQESVGGPIDVAVISRSDGFVWVKRKHYFDPSLNPRFFFRKYGMLVPAVGRPQT